MPRLLDLFCGAGGAAMGYSLAGFTEIVGVDNRPMPRYPFTFVQGDALEYVKAHGHEFDAIHASPPCQAYTSMRSLGKGAGSGAPELVEPVRDALLSVGAPWVIENVPGAPLRWPVILCGTMFGLRVYRHRLFESPTGMLRPYCAHDPAARMVAVYGDHPEASPIHRYKGRLGRHDGPAECVWRACSVEEARTAMDIDWMDWHELTQAIPPAYTEFIGRQLMQAIKC